VSRIASLSVTRAFQCQSLHASVLGFVHSVTGEALRFKAPVSPNMTGLIRALNDPPKDA
jgi:23S rRNA pseudouridine1911/1915/1917 synthase